MDDLRGRIWDVLYQLKEPQPVASLAERLQVGSGDVRTAVQDPWFDVRDDLVAIAIRNG